MKSILIIIYVGIHFGLVKYLFSQKRIAKQAAKKITLPFFVTHLQSLYKISIVLGLIGFIMGLYGILQLNYGLVIGGELFLIGFFAFNYYILGRTLPTNPFIQQTFSSFSVEGFEVTYVTAQQTKHTSTFYWKDIKGVYYNQDKTALLMEHKDGQTFFFPNSITNWSEIFEHLPNEWNHIKFEN